MSTEVSRHRGIAAPTVVGMKKRFLDGACPEDIEGLGMT